MVKLVDMEGKPVDGVTVWGRYENEWFSPSDNLKEQTSTRVGGFLPDRRRKLVFVNGKRKLGAMVTVTPQEAAKGDERTVVLRPLATVTGKPLDADGTPASEWKIEFRLTDPSRASSSVSFSGSHCGQGWLVQDR